MTDLSIFDEQKFSEPCPTEGFSWPEDPFADPGSKFCTPPQLLAIGAYRFEYPEPLQSSGLANVLSNEEPNKPAVEKEDEELDDE